MDEKDLFMKKFEEKLKEKLDKKTLHSLSKNQNLDEDIISTDYENFRLETLPNSISWYERYCNFCEKIVNLKADEKTRDKVRKQLYMAHLNCSENGVVSASMFTLLVLIIIGISILLFNTIIGFGLVLIGLGSYLVMQNMPAMMMKRARSKASDQVIIAVFYIVAFMRFNSNFELAVNFAASYLNPPLSLDFKRIMWELENAKYPTIKAAFDDYLEGWRDENLEFLEAIYLIESSLYESEDLRRISLLDKALDTILQGNYEKMLHFAQELRGKVSTFNMIGIVLPILGLIILPLAASFGDPKSTLDIVFILYDVLFPVLVGYFGVSILFNRPSSVNSIKPPKNLKDYANLQKTEIKFGGKKFFVSPKIPGILAFSIFFLIGISPILFHYIGIDSTLDTALSNIFGVDSPFGDFQDYKEIDGSDGNVYILGPYGVYPGLLSLFIPLSLAFGFGYYLRNKYKNLIHLRDKTKKLEVQFPSATFQLGNRINEGISAELAFGVVAETMKGTVAGEFFSKIDANVKFNGMAIEAAIFDEDKGAINDYPSDLIVSSMKILIRAIEKGPEITAKTLLDLSKYLSDIHMSNERMLDLLAESLGSMKGQANFLAPIISGVVIAIVSLVTMIMGSLTKATNKLASSDIGASQSFNNFLGESVPTYLFQSVVGIYIVMLIVILVYMTNSLENGEDPINAKYQIGEKMMGGLVKYSIVVAIGIILFSYVGSKVLGSIV